MGYEVRGVRDGVCGACEYAEPLPPTMSFAEMLAATRRAADESGHKATLVDDEGETVCGIAPSVPAGSLGGDRMSGAGRDARDAGAHGDRPHAEAKGSAMGRIPMADIDGTVAGCREGIEARNR